MTRTANTVTLTREELNATIAECVRNAMAQLLNEQPKAATFTEATPEAQAKAQTEATKADKLGNVPVSKAKAESTDRWVVFYDPDKNMRPDMRRLYMLDGVRVVVLRKHYVPILNLSSVYVTRDKAKAEKCFTKKSEADKASREASEAAKAEAKAKAEATKAKAKAEAEAKAAKAAKAHAKESAKASDKAKANKAKAGNVAPEAPKPQKPLAGRPWLARGAKQVGTREVKLDGNKALVIPVWNAPCKEHDAPLAILKTRRVANMEDTSIRAYARKGYQVECILHQGGWSWLYLASPELGLQSAQDTPKNWAFSKRRAAARRDFTKA